MSRDPEVESWTVLIVDDDIHNVMLLQAVFQLYGSIIHTTRDGLEALAFLQSVKPDVIVSDLAMPRMTGWELLEKIREQPHLDDVPVLALTAHATRNEPEQAIAWGFNGAMTKPFQIPVLIEALKAARRELLQQKAHT